jgi:hypothetical protein
MFVSNLTTFVLSAVFMVSGSQHNASELVSRLNLPYGNTLTQAEDHVKTEFANSLHSRIRATTDPLVKSSLRQEIEKMNATIKEGLTDTSKGKGVYRLAPVADYVATGEKSAVYREWTTGAERLLLFHNDQLYGAALSIPADGDLPDAVAAFSATLGRPVKMLQEDGRHSPTIGAIWRTDEGTLILRDFKMIYGSRLVIRLNQNLWNTAQKATNDQDQERKDAEGADDLFKEFIGR